LEGNKKIFPEGERGIEGEFITKVLVLRQGVTL